MPYDLRMGGFVGTVAGVPDVDGITIPVGFDYKAVTVGHYRFGPEAVTALMAAIVSGSLEAAKAVLGADTPCPECDGTGEIEVGRHTCGTGPDGYYGHHEPGCGTEPCPAGCDYVPPGQRGGLTR